MIILYNMSKDRSQSISAAVEPPFLLALILLRSLSSIFLHFGRDHSSLCQISTWLVFYPLLVLVLGSTKNILPFLLNFFLLCIDLHYFG